MYGREKEKKVQKKRGKARRPLAEKTRHFTFLWFIWWIFDAKRSISLPEQTFFWFITDLMAFNKRTGWLLFTRPFVRSVGRVFQLERLHSTCNRVHYTKRIKNYLNSLASTSVRQNKKKIKGSIENRFSAVTHKSFDNKPVVGLK